MLCGQLLTWLLTQEAEREPAALAGTMVYLKQGLAGGRGRGSPAGLYFITAHWFSLLSLALWHTPNTKALTPGDYPKQETHDVSASLVTGHYTQAFALNDHKRVTPWFVFLFAYIINAVK